MARVRVIGDDGWVALDEHTCGAQLESDQYRRYLAERIAWAVEDAEARRDAAAAPVPEASESSRPLHIAA